MSEKQASFKQKREFLKNHTTFSLLSNNLLKKIVSRLQVHHYGAGQIICERGTAGNCLYIIHTGSVVETLVGSRGEEITVAILREGDSFGTISLLTEEPYLATIKAKEDVELYVLCAEHAEDAVALKQHVPPAGVEPSGEQAKHCCVIVRNERVVGIEHAFIHACAGNVGHVVGVWLVGQAEHVCKPVRASVGRYGLIVYFLVA